MRARLPSSASKSGGGTMPASSRTLILACRSSAPVSRAITASETEEKYRPSPAAPSFMAVRKKMPSTMS